ncbi:hypothetical protein L218DRAFT_983681 [Marasmius fiardii PR-910]|nr:hypothetical protein L218DRAFT_983681 [Marasmius fiardii PR-910]
MITYRGTWPESRDTKRSASDYGGSHMVSSASGDIAVFTFTGVAVYYLAPLWPYAVSTSLSLNGGPKQSVNLTDPYATPTQGGAEPSPWSVRWSATNLPNATHTVIASISIGGTYVVVDGFTYTTNINGSSSGLIDKRNLVLIIVGVVIGVLPALAGVALGYWCFRRNKSRHGSTLKAGLNSRRTASVFLEPELGASNPPMQTVNPHNPCHPHSYTGNRHLSYSESSSAVIHSGHESLGQSRHSVPPSSTIHQKYPSPLEEKTRMTFSNVHQDFTAYQHASSTQVPGPYLIESGTETTDGSGSKPSSPPQSHPNEHLQTKSDYRGKLLRRIDLLRRHLLLIRSIEHFSLLLYSPSGTMV